MRLSSFISISHQLIFLTLAFPIAFKVFENVARIGHVLCLQGFGIKVGIVEDTVVYTVNNIQYIYTTILGGLPQEQF